MSALNNTVAPVSLREHVFVLNYVNTTARKRGEEGGDIEIKVLGIYSQDVLNGNCELRCSSQKANSSLF